MHPIQLELNHMVDAGLPGAFAFIEDANGTSQFYTAGFADLATQRLMVPESRYRIGSTTKTFTAVVLLQLESGHFAVFMLNGTYGFRVATTASSVQHPVFSKDMRALAYSEGTASY